MSRRISSWYPSYRFSIILVLILVLTTIVPRPALAQQGDTGENEPEDSHTLYLPFISVAPTGEQAQLPPRPETYDATAETADPPTVDDPQSAFFNFCYIRFSNQSDYKTHVYWVSNYFGKILYYTLPPGSAYWQYTYGSHQWIVSDEAGNTLRTVSGNACRSFYLYVQISNDDFPTAQATLPFRTIDGKVLNGDYANAGTANRRLLRTWYSPSLQRTVATGVRYADGSATPFNDPTLAPRFISNRVVAQTTSLPDPTGLSDMVWQWGQFLDHDLDFMPTHVPHEAFPIAVPSGDPYFDPTGTGTVALAFGRSNYDPTTGTTPTNPREQLNQSTAWIDGSQIYGSTDAHAAQLRTGVTGRLKSSADNLLPFDPNRPTQFWAGDPRANEQIGLIALHTLFVREHNRLAAYIDANSRNADDEYLYQMARQLVIAELQTITYEEFLPIVVGLGALPTYTGYNNNIDPGISNVFATAAYRFGHSMLPDTLWRLDRYGREIRNGHVALQDAFFRPELVIEDGIEPILYGLTRHAPQRVDIHVIDAVRNFLLPDAGGQRLDLPATNIQRGRDHGLAGYNQTRSALGLAPITAFSQIGSDADVHNALAEIYGDLDVIDLWVGGLAEAPVNGGLVGETFHTVIVDQFSRLRDADPFWYTTIKWADYGQFASDPIIHPDGTRLSQVDLAKIIEWNTPYAIRGSAFRR